MIRTIVTVGVAFVGLLVFSGLSYYYLYLKPQPRRQGVYR